MRFTSASFSTDIPGINFVTTPLWKEARRGNPTPWPFKCLKNFTSLSLEIPTWIEMHVTLHRLKLLLQYLHAVCKVSYEYVLNLSLLDKVAKMFKFLCETVTAFCFLYFKWLQSENNLDEKEMPLKQLKAMGKRDFHANNKKYQKVWGLHICAHLNVSMSQCLNAKKVTMPRC